MDDVVTTTRILSRRTVIRSAGHTAWAAPVIIAVSSAPAFAATGPADLVVGIESTSVSNPAPNGNYVVSAPTQITNRNSEPSTAASMTLVVKMDDGGSWNGLARTPTATATGWVASGPTVSDSGSPSGSVLAPDTRTWTFTAVQQVPGNGTKRFDVVIDTAQNAVVVRGDLTISVSPGATGTGSQAMARFGPPVPPPA